MTRRGAVTLGGVALAALAFAFVRVQPFVTDAEVATQLASVRGEEARARQEAGCAASDDAPLDVLADLPLGTCDVRTDDGITLSVQRFHDTDWAARHGLDVDEPQGAMAVPPLEDRFAAGLFRVDPLREDDDCRRVYDEIARRIASLPPPCSVLRSDGASDAAEQSADEMLARHVRVQAMTDLDHGLDALAVALRFHGAYRRRFAPGTSEPTDGTFAAGELVLALDGAPSTGALERLVAVLDDELARTPSLDAMIAATRRRSVLVTLSDFHPARGLRGDVPHEDAWRWGTEARWQAIERSCAGRTVDGCITELDHESGEARGWAGLPTRILGPGLVRDLVVSDVVREGIGDGEPIRSLATWPLRLAALRVVAEARLHRVRTGACADAAWGATPEIRALLATPWLGAPLVLAPSPPGRMDVVLPAGLYTRHDLQDAAPPREVVVEIYCPSLAGIGPEDPPSPATHQRP